MLTTSPSSSASDGHVYLIYDPEVRNNSTSYYYCHSHYDHQPSYQNDSTEQDRTYIDDHHISPSGTNSEVSSPPLDSILWNDLVAWGEQTYTQQEISEFAFSPYYVQNNGDQGTTSIYCNSLESFTGKRLRAASVVLSDSNSSDDESKSWPSESRQREFKDSNITSIGYNCPVCQKSYPRVYDLEEHAKHAKHKPFACRECKACFSRQDALTRHGVKHESQNLYPCTRCDKYRGSNAFRRLDHLHQHLRKKHRIHPNTEFPRYCSYECCAYSKLFPGFEGFRSRGDHSKHMREVHGKATYDCDYDGCNRAGKRGFARITDLQRHQNKVHKKLR